jgi:hypothetical protein
MRYDGYRMESNVLPDVDSVVQELHSRIQTSAYAVAEEVIDHLERPGLTDKHKRKLLKAFARATLQIIAVEDARNHPNPIDNLFSPSLQFWQKERVAVLLLRLFTHYPDATAVSEITSRAPALFDEVFEDNLYRLGKIDCGKQSYAKFEALKRLVCELEDELAGVVQSLSTLDALSSFRALYLKKINSGLARRIVHPFIPDQLIEQRFTSIIATVDTFRNTEGPSIIERYHQVVSSLDEYMQLASAMGTVYSDRYCGGVARQLRMLTDAFFNSTHFSKPATIEIGASEKKYPLSTPQSQFEIFLDISNAGPGFAFGVDLALIAQTDNLLVQKHHSHLGGIEPSKITVAIPVSVQHSAESALLEFRCTWTNFDGTSGSQFATIECSAQRSDIDWDQAKREDPYSLAAVSSVDQLVGRADILDQLIALTTGVNVESAFIRGQRRVGKTSIAKALANHLEDRYKQGYIVVFLEAGDYVGHDALTTIQFLGKKLCRAIKRSDPRLADLAIPEFHGALSPIIDFLEDARILVPTCRMLFILDEFDDLPLDLYRRGLIGDAFFRTIRSISNKEPFGFILIGSEKMDYVLSCQGDALNKFTPIAVDYFDKQHNWNDFQNLVRRPAEQYLDFTDSAISSIYDESAGNPYFAKLICRSLYSQMLERKDSFVTMRDVALAIEKTLAVLEGTSFQHFWLDGIHETGTRAEEISIIRRRVLLGFAEALREYEAVPRDEVIRRASAYQVSSGQIDNELREFERRRVLVCQDQKYATKIALFGKWMRKKGYQHILVTFVDYDAVLAFRKQQEQDRVSDAEIATVVGSWDLYLGRRIGPEQVRSWLAQFRDEAARRLMFTMLSSLRFYSGDKIRQKLREAHGIVGRSVVWQRKERQPKRRDLIVSALSGLAHSGAEYARRYADENMIYPDNVVDLSSLEQTLVKRPEAQAIVFIDDFIGTGQCLTEALQGASAILKSVVATGIPKLFLLTVVGFTEGQVNIERKLSDLGVPVTVHICDPLGDADKLFSDVSRVFPEDTTRLRAKDIAYEYGVALVPDAALGYGDTQAAIVFENKIPNNCPPILWKSTKTWTALFPRT